MNKKLISSTLMILGTCIGAGMLALPVVSAQQHFGMTLLLLFCAWLIMSIGAISLLEVNLWLHTDSNLISMAQATLGSWGKLATWFLYLILLYSLMSAYLSGIGDIFQAVLLSIDIDVPRAGTTILAVVLLTLIVHRGVKSVDIFSRGLMIVKLLAFLILVLTIAPHMHVVNLTPGNYHWPNSAFMVMITAFGYAIIIPSLRGYLHTDERTLKKVVLIGSLLPLIIYILWIVAVQGLLPRDGANGLIGMITSNNTNSDLMRGITQSLSTHWMGSVAKLFISICAVTSCLGVSICLVDFIADGLQLAKKGKQGWIVSAISFLPPLFIVLIEPGIFIQALAYAGVWCILLLIVLPLLMLYSGRHHKNLADDHLIPGGRPILILALLVALALLIYQFRA